MQTLVSLYSIPKFSKPTRIVPTVSLHGKDTDFEDIVDLHSHSNVAVFSKVSEPQHSSGAAETGNKCTDRCCRSRKAKNVTTCCPGYEEILGPPGSCNREALIVQ